MTLGRQPEDIAALVAAFFPRFPVESMDNQYHLQALRHFYALAARRSDICAIDVDTGEKVYVSIEAMSEKQSILKKMRVPCLLLSADFPVRFVRVVSDEFYPMTIRIRQGSNHFFVKRRNVTGLQAPSLSIEDNMTQVLSQLENLSLNSVDKGFLAKLVAERQSKDKYCIVLIFLSLMIGLRNMRKESLEKSIRLVWDLRLLRSFTESHVLQNAGWHKFLPLESQQLLPFLLERAWQSIICC